MLKTFKEWLAGQNISDWSAQTIEEKARLQKEFMQYVSTEMKKAQENMPEKLTPEQQDKAQKEAFKALLETQEMKDFATRIEEAEDKAAQALESASKGGKKGVTLEKALADEKEAVKALVKGGASKEVVLKADTLRASIATNPSGYFLPNIGQLGVKAPGLYDVLPKVPVSPGNHQGLIRYVDWDEATVVRAAAAVAEGGTFPESTAAFKGYSKEIIKLGDTLPVSEEFGEDEVTAAAELEMFLDTNLRTVRDDKLVNGPGTAGEMEGLLTASPAYVPVASGIVAPNIYDLVKKVKTDITFNRGSKYSPDIVVMNDNTADELHLTKDANENYIFPDTMNIGSMVIVIDNNLADNVMIVGDRRYARIYEMVGITLSRGLVAEQFVEDMETIKVRTRLMLLVRNVDKTGFRKVTDIDAALVTLGS